MLIQEKFDLMDWASYGEERRSEGKAEGFAEDKAEGKAKGKAEGIAEGERNLAELIQKLLATGRTDDIERVTRDPEYRETLYKEFEIGNVTAAADE